MYLGVLVFFIILVLVIEWANQYMNALVINTFDYVGLRALVQITGYFLFGLFLGGLNFIQIFKEDGSWKINKERLLALGLPVFIILMLNGTAFFKGTMMPQIIQKMLFYIMTMGLTKYIAIFLGYIVITSFTKEKRSVITQ